MVIAIIGIDRTLGTTIPLAVPMSLVRQGITFEDFTKLKANGKKLEDNTVGRPVS